MAVTLMVGVPLMTFLVRVVLRTFICVLRSRFYGGSKRLETSGGTINLIMIRFLRWTVPGDPGHAVLAAFRRSLMDDFTSVYDPDSKVAMSTVRA